MPKVGMEPVRRSQLVEATIAEIGAVGSLDVTVGQIAKRAGMSSALAHHYFGGKDQIFLAAMRHILKAYGSAVRDRLSMAKTNPERLTAIIEASFSDENFRDEVISAWLNFYVRAQTNVDASRLLRVYQRRLQSNLVFSLRPLVGARAVEVAQGIGALIDGLYIRQALGQPVLDSQASTDLVLDYLERALKAGDE